MTSRLECDTPHLFLDLNAFSRPDFLQVGGLTTGSELASFGNSHSACV